MGQHADDMLEGFVCQECGEFFDDILNGGDAPGYPRTCDGCENTRRWGKPTASPAHDVEPTRTI